MHKIKLDYYWKPSYQFNLERVQELERQEKNKLKN